MRRSFGVDRTQGKDFVRRGIGKPNVSVTLMYLMCFKSGPEFREQEDGVFASLFFNSGCCGC